MCGIIGAIADNDVVSTLLEGLRRVEYRGYDSAGLSIQDGCRINTRRAVGKLQALREHIAEDPIQGMLGIAHTRWATHGRPSKENAHPHATGRVSVVHNGIIENFHELREECQSKGVTFLSQTDTEVISWLLDLALDDGLSPIDAFSSVLPKLKGAYALAVIWSSEPETLMGARVGSPLAVGYGAEGRYLGSDALALAHVCDAISYLEDGDFVVANRREVTIFDRQGHETTRDITPLVSEQYLVERGQYRHFMLKEMHEQPTVVGQTIARHVDMAQNSAIHADAIHAMSQSNSITFLGCGTAHYAGIMGRYWFEEYAGLPSDAEIASEYRYRKNAARKNHMVCVVSQSGETSDTLAAMRHASSYGYSVLGVVNVPHSSMAREAEYLLPTHAGVEIGVASTKALACQMAVLATTSVLLGYERGVLSEEQKQSCLKDLVNLPRLMGATLETDSVLQKLAKTLLATRYFLVLGRGGLYPVALEAALKVKELSYVSAEGYPSGELKHGPIALIEDGVPVVCLLHEDIEPEKAISNLEEVHARGARVIAIGDHKVLERVSADDVEKICIPSSSRIQAAFAHLIPMQMLAYHLACMKGTDVDQPRNLAKSVTVE